ncbi:MAG: L-seryl-tRNA(Sec) selenium transferase, partial [Pyrinomonadaceae bacterium]
PSNYRIVGFTAMPSLAELADLAHDRGLLLYEDIGSGALIDLTDLGLSDEPVVGRSIVAGADIVTFSGDKLLGGPQAGIIAGKSEFVDRLRKHPLYRALRVDKLTYAALEATLEPYRRGAAMSEVPILKMLSLSTDDIKKRAERFSAQLTHSNDLKVELIDGESAIGGGAAPAVRLATKLIALSHKKISAANLENRFRNSTPPVITRIADDRVVIDLRTVPEGEEEELREIINRVFEQNPA